MSTGASMQLDDLIGGLGIDLKLGSARGAIEAVVEDSRQARPGCLFVARLGKRSDGRRFIPAAIEAGAVAVLTDRTVDHVECANHLVCDDVAATTAFLAEQFHGHPSSHLDLVGVTGTNGKSTVTSIVQQMLNHADRRCGLMGTVHVDDGRGAQPAKLTTPAALEISAVLRRMVDHDCVACAMEVSSHALVQARTAALRFAGAIFTNITGDHLDYHGTVEAYVSAKAVLFESLLPSAWAVLNVDDPAAAAMAAACAAPVVRCSLADRAAECFAEIRASASSFTDVTFHGPWGRFDVRLPLIGRYNVMNALEATAAGHALGLDGPSLASALARCAAPPGRLEIVTRSDDAFTVLVDYAHTDDALHNVLAALRPITPEGGQLTVVFGCGGDRDRTKRPRMAAAAWRWCDRVFITSDNPRTESPAAIIEEILGGVPPGRRAATVPLADRADAITTAISEARGGDIVVITGKGHEDYQIVGTTKRPFDDRLVAARAVEHRRRTGVG